MVKEQKIKVVILCGGRGTRLKEETEFKPKPLVEIGNKPILWHIMKIYAQYGFKNFIFCLGYKGNMIKDYFLNYEAMNSDFSIRLGVADSMEFHNNHHETDWHITLVDTGEEAQTGTRIRRIKKYIDGNLFMVTYGDGIGNVNIEKLIKFHKSHGKIATITAVHPSSRFGEILVKRNRAIRFNEKPQVSEGLINGGFFVFNKKFFQYLNNNDQCYLEREPLEDLASEKQLMVYHHNGFWQCVDTYRELELLNELWKSPNPPWKVWET